MRSISGACRHSAGRLYLCRLRRSTFVDLQTLEPFIGKLGDIIFLLIGDYSLQQSTLLVEFTLQKRGRRLLGDGYSAGGS